MLRVFQRQLQHSAGCGNLLRVNADLQVIPIDPDRVLEYIAKRGEA